MVFVCISNLLPPNSTSLDLKLIVLFPSSLTTLQVISTIPAIFNANFFLMFGCIAVILSPLFLDYQLLFMSKEKQRYLQNKIDRKFGLLLTICYLCSQLCDIKPLSHFRARWEWTKKKTVVSTKRPVLE